MRMKLISNKFLISHSDIMFVCLCNGYRDSDLRALASLGVDRVEDAYAALGGAPACRQCLDCAQAILDREIALVAGRELAARRATAGKP